MLSYQATWRLSAGIPTNRLPHSAHPSIVPFQFFETADGYIAIACAKEKFFLALAEGLGMPELTRDPRFASFAARLEHRETLTDLLAERLRQRTTEDWLGRLRGDVPCAPVRDLAEVLEPESLRARDMLAEYDHPRLGPVRGVGLPVRAAGFAPGYRPAPALDADAREVLTEIGLDDQQIARLGQRGAFGAGRGDVRATDADASRRQG
jgi:crotonobetainyl-CoA:carnitine CoA-transferase CaiB-like acyl-CoA transferase